MAYGTNAGVKCAVYIRKSKAADRQVSLDVQETEARAEAGKLGFAERQIVVFRDDDFSGKSGDRPGFQEMFRRIDKGEFSHLIMWKLDRFMRNVGQGIIYLKRAWDAGLEVRSVHDPMLQDPHDPMSRAMIQLLLVFAELELSTITLRNREAMKALHQSGRWRGSWRPFGWQPTLHPDGLGLWLGLRTEVGPYEFKDDSVEPLITTGDTRMSEQELAWEMVQRALEGWSASAIARDLTARRVVGTRGGRWTANSVLKFLRNPILIGQQEHKGEVLKDEDGQPIPHAEPLVDLWTWNQLQRRLRRPSQADPKKVAMTTPFLRCGRCGARMNGGGTGSRLNYGCAESRAHGVVGECGGNFIKRDAVDGVVARAVAAALTPGLVQQVREQVARDREALESDPTRVRVEALRLEIAETEVELKKPGRGARAKAALADAIDEYEAELNDLQAELSDASAGLSGLPDVDLEAGITADALLAMDAHVAQQWIECVISEVVVLPAKRRGDAEGPARLGAARVMVVPREG